jgi:ankyrin repeat protein
MDGSMAPPEWDLLLSAAQKNESERLRDMIQNQKVNASHANAVGQSALHIAALWAHVESVQVLLEGGANVNAQNTMTGATPLHMVPQFRKATIEKRLQVLDLLLQAGADVTRTDSYGHTPVYYASSADSDPDAAQLVQLLQPEKSPLFDAVTAHDLESVQQLLFETDTALVSVKFGGHTPLQACISCLLSAAETTDDEKDVLRETARLQLLILKALLAAGSDTNVGSEGADEQEDLPPLHRICCALRNSYKEQKVETQPVSFSLLLQETVVVLVDAGASLPGITVQLLHDAARRNETRMARFLVETMKVDPNSRGRQDMTPLQFAARSGRVQVLEYLLSLPQIDVSAADSRGQTALDAAKINQHVPVVRALEAHMHNA